MIETKYENYIAVIGTGPVGLSVAYNLIKKNKKVCLIDVGSNKYLNHESIKSSKTKSGWKLLGDVDFFSVRDKCSFITPVPGGVGPMTIASLLRNTLFSAKKIIYSHT